MASYTLQFNGIWKGLTVWDKGRNARLPNPSWMRHQAEYVVWGVKERMPKRTKEEYGLNDGTLFYDGVIREMVNPKHKRHIAWKPPTMLEKFMSFCPRGGVVLDPFAGSATIGVAAIRQGRRYIGCEVSSEIFDVAVEQLKEEEARLKGATADGTTTTDVKNP